MYILVSDILNHALAVKRFPAAVTSYMYMLCVGVWVCGCVCVYRIRKYMENTYTHAKYVQNTYISTKYDACPYALMATHIGREQFEQRQPVPNMYVHRKKKIRAAPTSA